MLGQWTPKHFNLQIQQGSHAMVEISLCTIILSHFITN